MTFDGRIAMSIVVKKPTSVFTLNAHNLNIISLKLTDILQRPVAVAGAIFPCLDEPSYKAVKKRMKWIFSDSRGVLIFICLQIFSIELVYPSSHVPLANMMEEKTIELKNGWSRVIFKPTPLMSTYLVAFTIGPYVSSKITNQDGTLLNFGPR
ncbi:hypothetical protein NECAME_00550 [Necator americanus]|uniref:Aminopeptidase N-like N-terminal domain-containing protein n=1 Tax=Necator americanus TaxID=51031 RepID=W2T0P8_NECAM|nr:hypothetical protein NECAME_00550 [Necator americanus]ETN75139.1 hypothetical protein NECAME_00550 [Necator americanus]